MVGERLDFNVVVATRFPVEFDAHAHLVVGGGDGAVVAQVGLDDVEVAGAERFIDGERRFGIFPVEFHLHLHLPVFLFGVALRWVAEREGIAGGEGSGMEGMVARGRHRCGAHRVLPVVVEGTVAGRIGRCEARGIGADHLRLEVAVVDDEGEGRILREEVHPIVPCRVVAEDRQAGSIEAMGLRGQRIARHRLEGELVEAFRTVGSDLRFRLFVAQGDMDIVVGLEVGLERLPLALQGIVFLFVDLLVGIEEQVELLSFSGIDGSERLMERRTDLLLPVLLEAFFQFLRQVVSEVVLVGDGIGDAAVGEVLVDARCHCRSTCHEHQSEGAEADDAPR